ncbi:ATPase [Sporocytophaga myxococcoides]|uniref:ATPase n=1 Tax=Sporocytophaga myxococcoides TaxID=153721 RepID=A0A098LGR2_9BACT|nr:START-like domain-containing protein [Sporocytophaga myxococcoides]GAL86186.1 ATPase [Sporocytophaga myxococcoides]
MENKFKYTAEFEINASSKMIFPYLSTALGLKTWFADKVISEDEKRYDFIWDGRLQKAKKVAQKNNQYVKFEFAPEETETQKNNSYLEFSLQENEITQTSFLKVVDYSDTDSNDLQNMWKGLIENLREKVGA